MGYGGSIEKAGHVIGREGDKGIYGIIIEDVLCLDVLYIQAKKWDGIIGRQKFKTLLEHYKVKELKKNFITTGNFSKEVKAYTHNIDSKIVLFDGKQITEYMIDKNKG